MASAGTRTMQGRHAVLTSLVLCFLIAMQEGFDITGIAVVAPRLAAAAHLTKGQLGVVLSMSNIGLAIGAPLGGWLADRFGRKPLLILSTLLFGIFTLLTSLANDWHTLILVRFCAGVGFGGVLPTMMVIVAEIVPPERRSAAVTAIFCGMPLGAALGSIYVANLPSAWSWHSVYYIGGTAPIILSFLAMTLMSEPPRVTTRKARAHGALRSVFSHDRLIPTLLLWVIFFFTLVVLYILGAWLPSIAVEKGLGAPQIVHVAGLAIGLNPSFVFSLAGAIGAPLFGAVVDRVGYRWPTLVAYCAIVGSLTCISYSSHLPTILLFSGIAGWAIMGANYALYSVAVSIYPPEAHGVGAGLAMGFGRVGSAAGPIIFGFMLGGGINVNAAILSTAGAAIIAGAAVLLLSLSRPVYRLSAA